jgi:PadR family transcriptional regulator, regulatory protein AphA
MSLPHLILGLLSRAPLSGYDLNKTFQNTVQHFWTTEQSQIYRALYKMEENGWVKVETIIQEDSPNKKIYHVTEAGHRALHEWLTTPLEDEPTRENWLGQIFFGGLVADEELFSLIRASIAALLERLAAMEHLQATFAPYLQDANLTRDARFQFITLDYGVARHRFEIQWLEDVIERIRQFPDPSDEQEPGEENS